MAVAYLVIIFQGLIGLVLYIHAPPANILAHIKRASTQFNLKFQLVTAKKLSGPL